MSAPFVVVFPRGQLTAKDKERLTKGGVIAVEADTPGEVVQMKLTTPLSLDSSLVTGDLIVSSLLAVLAKQPSHDSNGFITGVGMASHDFVKTLAAAVNNSAKATA